MLYRRPVFSFSYWHQPPEPSTMLSHCHISTTDGLSQSLSICLHRCFNPDLWSGAYTQLTDGKKKRRKKWNEQPKHGSNGLPIKKVAMQIELFPLKKNFFLFFCIFKTFRQSLIYIRFSADNEITENRCFQQRHHKRSFAHQYVDQPISTCI